MSCAAAGELEPAGAEAVGGSPLAHAQHPELVPFAHFEDGLAGAGELLEPLEAHAGHAGHAEPDAVHAAHHGLAGPTLVPFSDFHGSGEGLLEPLEAGDDNGLEEAGWGAEGGEGAVALSGGSRDWEGPSQLSGLGATGSSQTSQQRLIQSAGTSGSGSIADVEQLVAALQSCAGACGALAAVDSQQYLTGLCRCLGLLALRSPVLGWLRALMNLVRAMKMLMPALASPSTTPDAALLRPCCARRPGAAAGPSAGAAGRSRPCAI